MEAIYHTHIGDEIAVTVHFYIEPFEPMTHDYPGCDEEIDVTAVLVNGDEDSDIFEVLSKEAIAALVQSYIDSREPEEH